VVLVASCIFWMSHAGSLRFGPAGSLPISVLYFCCSFWRRLVCGFLDALREALRRFLYALREALRRLLDALREVLRRFLDALRRFFEGSATRIVRFLEDLEV
jgi:hypothetical protein